jgi:hypothetical protein
MPKKHGGKFPVVCIMFLAALSALTSCTPKVRIHLVNECGVPIQIVNRSRPTERIEEVQNSNRTLLEGTNPLIIRANGIERRYDLSNLPSEFIQTTAKGLVLSVVLGDDWQLYLLSREKPPVNRLVPQPLPFPLRPS